MGYCSSQNVRQQLRQYAPCPLHSKVTQEFPLGPPGPRGEIQGSPGNEDSQETTSGIRDFWVGVSIKKSFSLIRPGLPDFGMSFSSNQQYVQSGSAPQLNKGYGASTPQLKCYGATLHLVLHNSTKAMVQVLHNSTKAITCALAPLAATGLRQRPQSFGVHH